MIIVFDLNHRLRPPPLCESEKTHVLCIFSHKRPPSSLPCHQLLRLISSGTAVLSSKARKFLKSDTILHRLCSIFFIERPLQTTQGSPWPRPSSPWPSLPLPPPPWPNPAIPLPSQGYGRRCSRFRSCLTRPLARTFARATQLAW